MATVIMKSGLTEKGCVWHDVSDQKSEAVFKLLCELGEDTARQEKLLKEGSPVVLHEMGELKNASGECDFVRHCMNLCSKATPKIIPNTTGPSGAPRRSSRNPRIPMTSITVTSK